MISLSKASAFVPRSIWALILTAACALAACAGQQPTPQYSTFNTVEYRGKTIALARDYSSFDEYKDDEDNLPAASRELAATLVKEAPFPRRFSDRHTMDIYFLGQDFPGYGVSALQLREPTALYSLEIPGANLDRWFVAIERGGAWHIVDDFLWSSANGYIHSARVDHQLIEYFDNSDNRLRSSALQ